MEKDGLLEQVLQAMQEQTEVLTKMISEKVAAEISAAETRINLKIENEVIGKMEALFDGYKLTHEKQWEMERKSQQMEDDISKLKARVSALEDKIA
ncbi:MAG: hypothetical protein HFG18_08655 [Oscillospiraceae bacterium]|nr:hypothetical protein [Oscillospiraceae bacterium]MCI9669619.1 hypothetical protein [Oscillospiraceae bacterium]